MHYSDLFSLQHWEYPNILRSLKDVIHFAKYIFEYIPVNENHFNFIWNPLNIPLKDELVGGVLVPSDKPLPELIVIKFVDAYMILLTWTNFGPAWISDYLHYEMWVEITDAYASAYAYFSMLWLK